MADPEVPQNLEQEQTVPAVQDVPVVEEADPSLDVSPTTPAVQGTTIEAEDISQDVIEIPPDISISNQLNSKKEQAIRAAMTTVEGDNPVFRYADALDEDPYVTMQATMDQADAEIKSLNIALLEESLRQDALARELVAEDIHIRKDRERQPNFQETIAPDVAVVHTMPGSDTFSEEEVTELATQLYIRRMIGSQLDLETSGDWFDAAVDLTGIFLVPDQSFNIAAVVKEIFPERSFYDRYFDSADMWLELGASLNQLPPPERIVAYQEINKIFKDVDDNDLERMLELMELANPSTGFLNANLSHSLDKISVVPVLGQAIGILKTPSRVMNAWRFLSPLKTSSNASDLSTMNKIITITSKSDEGAQSLSSSRLESVAAVDPGAASLEARLLQGMPVDKSTHIKEVFRANDLMVERGLDVVDEMLGLTKAEKLQALEKTKKAMASVIKADQEKVEGALAIENITYKTTDKGIEVSYLQGVGYGVPEKVVKNIKYTTDDITTGFEGSTLGMIKATIKVGLSPNYLFKKDKASLVHSMERLLMQESKIKGVLTQELVTPFKVLNNKGRENVANMLAYGDSKGAEYTYTQLKYEGVNGIKLTDPEITAYIHSRRSMDRMHVLKNKELRNTMQVQGMKEVTVLGETKNAKVMSNVDVALRDVGKDSYVYQPNKIGDDGLPVTSRMTPEEITKAYQQGYVIARTSRSDPFGSQADGSLFALVNHRDVSELSALVLKKRVGYIPRVYDKARYFVQAEHTRTIDKVDEKYLKTMRYFDNIADAEKFTELENAKSGSLLHKKPYFDREGFNEPLGDDTIRLFGTMYNGERSAEPLKFGLRGDDAVLQDPLQAMGDYINHISSRLPMSEYRLGIQERWLSHVRDIDPTLTGGFRETAIAIKGNKAFSPEEEAFTLSSRDQIQNMLKMPTDGEVKLQNTIRAFADSASRGGHSKLAQYLYGGGSAVDGIKGANFTLLLGMYSPVQTVVQGFGASVAASINPLMFAKATRHIPAITRFDLISDPTEFAKAMKLLQKSDPDLAEQYKLWDKTGLKESVLNASPDMNSMFRGNPFSGSVVSKVMRNNTAFFTTGELFNMRASFGTAVELFKSQNNIKKGYKFTDTDLKDILARTESYRLHMSAANRAGYQKGLSGIPTQFQQVNTKFLETLAGSDFTKTEKSKLAIGQTVLFGSLGVPLATTTLTWVLDQAGVTVDDVDATDMIVLKNGMTGWLLNDLLDTDALLTGRVAFGGEFLESMYEAIFTVGMEAPYRSLLGPTGNLVDLGLGVWDDALYAYNATINHDDLGDVAIVTIANLFESITDSASSTRNLIAAYEIANNSIFVKANGDIVKIDDGDMIARTIAQAIGVQSISMKDMYELGKSDRARLAAMGSYRDRVVKSLQAAHRYRLSGETKLQKASVAVATSLINSIKNLEERDTIIKSIRNKINTPDDAAGRLYKKAFDAQGGQFSNGTLNFNTTFLKVIREQEEK